jgi:hypothetical protein
MPEIYFLFFLNVISNSLLMYPVIAGQSSSTSHTFQRPLPSWPNMKYFNPIVDTKYIPETSYGQEKPVRRRQSMTSPQRGQTRRLNLFLIPVSIKITISNDRRWMIMRTNLSKIVALILFLCFCVSCTTVVHHRPLRPKPRHAVWVSGHRGPRGHWVPGHWVIR